jgi:hypothetical protein
MSCSRLTNIPGYTIFSYKDKTIKFSCPRSLEYYDSVKTWDNGYIVVMAKFTHNARLEEEYIDLQPVLENLYMDAGTFLQPINKVEINNNRANIQKAL